MRVSDTMITQLVTRGVTAAAEDQYAAQSVTTSGMRVQKPSDDPIAAGRARATTSVERRNDTIAKMAQSAEGRLQEADATLLQIGDVMSRARELAVLGANDHLSASDRVALAEEVQQLRSVLLAQANSKIEGEYVFSGLAVDQAPFDAAGTFVGSTTLREIEVGPGLRMPTQVDGARIFGAGGGVNPFTTLDDLEASLRANDGAAVSASLVAFDAIESQISRGHAEIGGAQQGMLQARAAAERVRDDATRRRAELTEASPVEAFTELMRAQRALRESLAIAARMPPPSLVTQGGG